MLLVYTTQVNSTFRARGLASSEVISQVLFTSEQPEKNKMAFAAIFSHTGTGGVLGQDFWDTPTARFARRRASGLLSQNAPPSLCVRRFAPYSTPNVCRFRLMCKYFCHNVCSLKFIFCWRNAEVNIERNGGCKFFERCSWNVLRLYREQSRPSKPNFPKYWRV